MPKRVIDFDAMWGSDKLASCAEWAQAEYAWLYGLADASGCFEVTNLRVIWGRVAAVRRNLTIERLEQIFEEFQNKGLLFVWEHEGKQYAHWTGSDVPGRLPPPSWRMRLERLAPPVPRQQFAEYVSRFARGRAALPGGGFRGEAARAETRDEVPTHVSLRGKFENSSLTPENNFAKARTIAGLRESALAESGTGAGGLPPLKGGVEEAQAQDWNWNLEGNRSRDLNSDGSPHPVERGELSREPDEAIEKPKIPFSKLNSNSQGKPAEATDESRRWAAAGASAAQASIHSRDKSYLVTKELNVGRGPVCGPVKVKPEALERIRMRLMEKAAGDARNGSRSP